MNDTIVLIPVRLQASRFPNKPFAKIGELPMMHYVFKAVSKSGYDVYLAICDNEIKDYCEEHKLPFIMTDPKHPSGSDRIGEAIKIIEKKFNYEFIINVQGDMPFVSEKYINSLRDNLASYKMTTLACPFTDNEEAKIISKVKVKINEKDNTALDFSRKINNLENINKTIFHHIGIYGFQKIFLKEYISLPVSERERKEKLEQLRVIEQIKIHVTKISEEILGVDTVEDLDKVNKLIHKYE
tara:strand:- start:2044 stop:2766 length:723 start_codon:yes stop_codon:yes gene_type:complete